MYLSIYKKYIVSRNAFQSFNLQNFKQDEYFRSIEISIHILINLDSMDAI